MEVLGMHAYSQDLRDRVLRALERGDRPSDIARRLEVSRVWVYEVRKRFRDQGERCSHRMGGYRRSRIAHLEMNLRAWIKAEPDLTLAQLCERLAQQGVQIKVPALWHQLNKWNLSFKKNAARQRARSRRCSTGTPAVATKPA
jgi:transposase